MKIMFSLLVLVFLFAPTAILADTETDIKNHCREKWGTDYQMQNYCGKEMNEGLREITAKVAQYGKKGEENRIINKCWSKWYPQLDMVNYCAGNQITAFKTTKAGNGKTGSGAGGGTAEKIKSFCAGKWSSNYEMRVYCVKEMNEGSRKVLEMINRYGKAGEEYKIINRCWKKWFPQTDMVAYCSNNQLKAYRSLRQ